MRDIPFFVFTTIFSLGIVMMMLWCTNSMQNASDRLNEYITYVQEYIKEQKKKENDHVR